MKIKSIQNLIDLLRGKKKILDITLKKCANEEEFANINFVFESIMKNGFKIKNINAKNKTLIFNNKKIKLLTDFQYPWIIKEIYGDEIYKFKLNIDESRQYVVIDMGANRGYASLYFAQKDCVKEIYAFELVPQIFEFMQKNINLNPKYKNKIHTYCFGLGKTNCEIVYYNDGRDYATTINKEALLKTTNNIAKIEENIAKIKKASVAINDIVHKSSNDIILKIDVEGAEYDIIDDLVENYPAFFDKVVKIVGETHLGFDKFYDKIKGFGFKVDWKNPQENGTCPFEISKEKQK